MGFTVIFNINYSAEVQLPCTILVKASKNIIYPEVKKSKVDAPSPFASKLNNCYCDFHAVWHYNIYAQARE